MQSGKFEIFGWRPAMADEWSRRDRFSKLASILYPGNASETTRAEMASLAKNEQKQPPKASALLDHAQRGALSPLDGRAKP
jgi:hypothetical protein